MRNYQSEAKPKAQAGGVPVFCAHDAIVPIEKLVPNPKNPNNHPEEQIKLLGRIIKATGWRQPITVSNRSGFIVKGHRRLKAAQMAGLTEAPVDYQEYASEAEEYADLVADNRLAELSEIDNAMLADIFRDIDLDEIPAELTGYTEDEMADLLDALTEPVELEADEDVVPDEPAEVITKPGDIWLFGGAQGNVRRLYQHGSARAAFRRRNAGNPFDRPALLQRRLSRERTLQRQHWNQSKEQVGRRQRAWARTINANNRKRHVKYTRLPGIN